MSSEQKCSCGRLANTGTYGGKHWCCVQCFRWGQHTVFCDKRQKEN